MTGTTKNIIHQVGLDIENEADSLVYEKKSFKNTSFPIRISLSSVLFFIVYTTTIVLITWGITKQSLTSNSSCSSGEGNGDDYIPIEYPNTLIRKMEHVAIMTPNLTEARQWYEKYFGLKHTCLPNIPCYFMMNDMGLKIGVVPIPPTVTWVPPTLNGYHLAHFALEVRTVDDYISTRQRFINDNISIQGEHHYSDRSQSLYFVDLNGYGWEIFVFTDEDISIFT